MNASPRRSSCWEYSVLSESARVGYDRGMAPVFLPAGSAPGLTPSVQRVDVVVGPNVIAGFGADRNPGRGNSKPPHGVVN